MNRRLAFLLPLLAAASLTHAAPTDAEVEARKNVLEFAGAFTNEGFKLRDGHWGGAIKVGESKVVQVNLYAGNEYYFSAATAAAGKKVAITVFDETGKALPIEDPYQEGGMANVGFSPSASGSYYIKVEELEGDATAFCLVCSYK